MKSCLKGQALALFAGELVSNSKNGAFIGPTESTQHLRVPKWGFIPSDREFSLLEDKCGSAKELLKLWLRGLEV
jgi:hypothetical protein